MRKILNCKNIIVVLISLVSILFILFKPNIYLKGEKILNIEVGSNYKDAGINATFLFQKINNIIIRNNVDSKKIGKYQVVYDIKYNGKNYKKIRTVNVVDTESPIINFNGEDVINLCDVKKPKITITDNYDDILIHKLNVKKKNDHVIYSVSDSSGNVAVKIKKIIKKDLKKPIIKLNGEEKLNIYLGDNYNELGATAFDDCDGDISNLITIKNNVDTSKIGEYKVIYKVRDKFKNETKIIRQVNVIKKSDEEKIIYLTFDDGPSSTITSRVLDILKEENIKATFFVINHSEDLDYLIKRAYDEGHAIALHSFSHIYSQIYSSIGAYFNDLELIGNKVQNIIGIKPNIIRFPGGSSNTISKFNPKIMTNLVNEVINRGYNYFDWNISSGDAGGARNSNDVYNNVINSLNSKTNVVLLHDFESNYKTLDALKNIIITAKNMGYNFDKITESTPIVRHRVNN